MTIEAGLFPVAAQKGDGCTDDAEQLGLGLAQTNWDAGGAPIHTPQRAGRPREAAGAPDPAGQLDMQIWSAGTRTRSLAP